MLLFWIYYGFALIVTFRHVFKFYIDEFGYAGNIDTEDVVFAVIFATLIGSQGYVVMPIYIFCDIMLKPWVEAFKKRLNERSQ